MNIHGKVTRQVFKSEDGIFAVYGISPNFGENIETNKYGTITISGNVQFKVGTDVYISVEPDVNSKYPASYIFTGFAGINFENNNFTIDTETTYNILCQYMTDGQADSVITAYPDFVGMILRGEQEQISYKNIKGVGKIYLTKYIDKITTNCRDIKFMSACAKWGIKNTRDIAVEYFDVEEFEKAINKTPYHVLVDVCKTPFDKADELILSKIPDMETSYERCLYDIFAILEYNETLGNTRVEYELLKTTVEDECSECSHHFDSCMEDSKIFYNKENNQVALRLTYDQECLITNEIKKRINEPHIIHADVKKFFENDGMVLSEEQQQILQIVCDNDVCMLTAPGGCGKTTSVKAITRMLEDANIGYTLLAPTGVASKRLRESTDRPASTIHMFLAKQQTAEEVVIFDEASMISVELLSKILSCDGFVNNHKIIFVCDPAQLSSISCGNLAQDIMDSGIVPIVRLTKVFRYNTSGIATVVTDVRTNKTSSFTSQYADYHYEDINDFEAQIKNVYQNYLDSGYKIMDILCLSPFNKQKYGSLKINQILQEEFNQNPYTELGYKVNGAEIKFKVGDKVINKKNTYNMPIFEEEDTFFLANGDIGIIRDIGKDFDGQYYMTVEFDEAVAYITGDKIQNIRLAYCVSIHSVQGCESPAVICVLDKSHASLLCSNLIYVAMSRAKKHLSVIGNTEVIKDSIVIHQNLERNTYLKDLLKEN